MTYLFFCSSKILFHMNVSVLKEKSLSFILFMPFGWEILFIFCCFVPLCSAQVWRLEIVRVKFCNNIKRRYGRVNNSLFSISFLPSSMRRAQWMIAIVNIPASVQTHRYFWQAFDVALWWAVPLQWPLNWVNTPFTVQINAAALCFSEYLIAHHLSKMHFCFESTVGLMAPVCWRSGVVTFKPKCCFFCVCVKTTNWILHRFEITQDEVLSDQVKFWCRV